MKRKITVFATVGGTGKIIETEAKTWEELQADFTKSGISHSGMKVVDGISKNTLESPDAVLTAGDTTVFLFPQKTKSGAFSKEQVDVMAYSTLRATIKEAFETDKDSADAHFNATKNYTNKSTADLKNLLVEYKGKIGGTPVTQAKAVATKKKEVPTPKEATSVKKASPTTNVADIVKSAGDATDIKTQNEETMSKASAGTFTEFADLFILAIQNTDKADSKKQTLIHNIREFLTETVDTSKLRKQAEEIAKKFNNIGNF